MGIVLLSDIDKRKARLDNLADIIYGGIFKNKSDGKIILDVMTDPFDLGQYKKLCNRMEKLGYVNSEWMVISCNLHEDVDYSNWKNCSYWFYYTASTQISPVGGILPFTSGQIDILKTTNRDLDLMCLNGRHELHREFFIREIIRRKLWKKSLISAHFELDGVDELPSGIDFYIKGIDYKTKFDITENFDDSIPSAHDTININFNILEKVFFATITETHFLTAHGVKLPLKVLCISEKTYKFLSCIPIIVIGNKGVLKYLKKQGFKTFPDMFDESYDEIENDNERMTMVIDEIEKFCKLDYDTKMDKYLKSFDNILHNQEVYLTKDKNILHKPNSMREDIISGIINNTLEVG